MSFFVFLIRHSSVYFLVYYEFAGIVPVINTFAAGFLKLDDDDLEEFVL